MCWRLVWPCRPRQSTAAFRRLLWNSSALQRRWWVTIQLGVGDVVGWWWKGFILHFNPVRVPVQLGGANIRGDCYRCPLMVFLWGNLSAGYRTSDVLPPARRAVPSVVWGECTAAVTSCIVPVNCRCLVGGLASFMESC